MRSIFALCGLAFLVLNATPAPAATVHVPTDVPTIQLAIMAAQAGDEVVVAPGVYYETIDLLGKAITVRGAGSAESTIIDGSDFNQAVIRCDSNETTATVIRNLTIRHGRGTAVAGATIGGGMLVQNANPRIIRCIFEDNHAANGGGAIAISLASPRIDDCTFILNSTSIVGQGGGAILIEGGAPVIRRARFFTNDGGFLGGAISMIGSAATLSDCLFVANEAVLGGAVRVSGGAPRIVNGTFSHNAADPMITGSGSAIRCDSKAQLALTNSILWETGETPLVDLAGATTTASHCTIQFGFEGEAILTSNPRFLDPAGDDDVIGTLDDVFGLRANSPAIDAGTNSALVAETILDLLRRNRVIDGDGDQSPIVDHGAAEFEPIVCAADCQPMTSQGIGNGVVNIDELIAVINAMGTTDTPCDVAPSNPDGSFGDGVIDIDDLVTVITSFGGCGT
ncbi:MAG: hypothetical protein AAF432_11775 [Planctomycetota bacterium]